jgi:DNA-binding Lrp family transcriptional regulator
MIKKYYNNIINGVNNHYSKAKSNYQVDELDYKIIDLMVKGNNNKQIASEIKAPLSTVQRRTKRLILEQTVLTKTELNYEKFGFKRGLLHLYVANGDIEKIVKEVTKLKGVSSVEVHIGNSDIIGNVIYKNAMELLDLMTDAKKMDGVDKVVWSEQIYSFPANSIEIKGTI